jgi:hypothetical protein
LNEPLAYIESGIWIAIGIGNNDIFYASSKTFINDNIETNKIKGVVSLLSLLEAIQVIRTRITSNTEKIALDFMNDDKRKQYLSNICEEKIKILIQYLRTKEDEKKLFFTDFSIVDLNNVYNESFQFLSDYFGYIPFYPRCGRCYQIYPHYEYKGVGGIDLLHAYLAKECYCSLFVTTDGGFRDLEGLPQFLNIHFEVLPSKRR